ncbi:TetR/AcrR family transcriptional regulator [Lactiplantibacillus sp. WILCCON 0030]|uniref:TetR/AcrR family transcriptional regulator n=1 Tax=Lactiplantibacillus brownii TaxID=3069269 RepID=A0ABU1A805_9LACO|nr:TetR/AcrR family transcriptional regulator [Lactiplantibacillus brownii]MDQ7937006.1 TetR/AcrR family transcriptional regulator [Lactiplantibacillus brownii]
MKIKDQQKYDRLIAAAIQLLATDGLAPFSTTKVAKQAGIPQSNVYIYFKNKQALLNATYTVAVHQMSLAVVASFSSDRPLVDQTATSIAGLYQFAMAQPAMATAIQVLIDDSQFKQQAPLKLDDVANQQIQQALKLGIQTQVFQAVDLNLIRYFLTRPVFHYVSGVQAGDYPADPQGLSALTAMILRAILTPTAYHQWQH